MSTTALTSHTQPLGSPASWARDFALIGAVTGFAAPAPFWWGTWSYLAACSAAGALLGAALGFVGARALVGPFSRWPFGVLLVVGLGLGAGWGAGTGFIAGTLIWKSDLVVLSALCGAFAGALQLGWVWLPYLLRRSKGRSGWPVMVAACVISGGLGMASLYGLGLLKVLG